MTIRRPELHHQRKHQPWLCQRKGTKQTTFTPSETGGGFIPIIDLRADIVNLFKKLAGR